MAISTIYPNGVNEVVVPATQSIAISNFGGGIASIYYLIVTANYPPAYQLQQTLNNSSVVLGAFADGMTIKIEAGSSTVRYDVGASPDTGIGDADTLNGLASDTAATADTIAARDSSGDITANAFESTVATGTAPLTVASTTVVSNFNADLLDGQEGSYYAVAPIESTFTPVIEGSTTAGTGTYTTQSGSYQKIGNWVSFRILLDWTAHTGTGNFIISGLPFTAANTRPTPCTILPSNITYTGDFIVGRIIHNTDTIQIMNCTTAAASSNVPIDTVGIVFISGFYEAA